MALTTDVATGDPGHAALHNAERSAINAAGAEIVQTAAGAAVAARPSLPDGMVTWSLYDAPGTVDGPDDVSANDKVFNLSGEAWA